MLSKADKEGKESREEPENRQASENRRVLLLEDEKAKLSQESKYLKTQNETATKHLIDMDELYKTNLQKLNDNIALKE